VPEVVVGLLVERVLLVEHSGLCRRATRGWLVLPPLTYHYVLLPCYYAQDHLLFQMRDHLVPIADMLHQLLDPALE
jgi:hypothetical protein